MDNVVPEILSTGSYYAELADKIGYCIGIGLGLAIAIFLVVQGWKLYRDIAGDGNGGSIFSGRPYIPPEDRVEGEDYSGMD